MAKLTLAERQEMQTVLEQEHAGNVEFYRDVKGMPAASTVARDIVMGEMLMAFNAAAIAREAPEPQVQGRPLAGPPPRPSAGKPNGL